MAKTSARIDSQGPREGHGDSTQHSLNLKKGKFSQVGSAVDMSDTAYSPNRKTGTASGTNEH